MRRFEFYVYILASKRNSTLYIGVTNNLKRKIEEHRIKKNKSFTTKGITLKSWFILNITIT
ncbi:GIY-YIG nuclease family protein [Maribellus mangrovi]|uniref:GIY-YIG nuclease family protein n=1 Tax=Maribellus mangrovi TaxID=3133146 RepID=UPI00345FE2BF